jgi:DNA-binding NtrC family response regulator
LERQSDYYHGLLDIRMPGLDGLKVLRKAREGGSDTAVIIMTAHGDSSAAIDAMQLGAFDYVAKPIDFDMLLPQLRRAIEHRKLAKSAVLDAHHDAPAAPPFPVREAEGIRHDGGG